MQDTTVEAEGEMFQQKMQVSGCLTLGVWDPDVSGPVTTYFVVVGVETPCWLAVPI